MNIIRLALLPFATLALAVIFPPTARADVRTLQPFQTLTRPASPSYQHFGVGVAIDGPHLIVIAMNSSSTPYTYAALLYRRNNSDGKWVYRRTLVTTTGTFARADVRMKNNIAVVNLGGQVSMFEYGSGDYVPAKVAAPIRHPGGVAISADSVLIGGDGCDYDGVVYQKDTNGVWGITGRLDDNTGECDVDGMQVELNYNYALIRHRYRTFANAWRRTGTAIDWVPAGVIALPAGSANSVAPYALNGQTAVANNGDVYLRSGTSTWTRQPPAVSVDKYAGNGVTFSAVYRDRVLVTAESAAYLSNVRIHVETSAGRFEHLATLDTAEYPAGIDVSGRTVAVAAQDINYAWSVQLFTLPTPLRAPAPIVNDFEDGQTSDFEAQSGQFQLATRGANDVLAQNDATGLAISLAVQSDWTDYQRVEANITQTAGGAGSWVGLIARYVDANNYYYAAIRTDRTYSIRKRVNGVETVLREGSYYSPVDTRARFVVASNEISLQLGYDYFPVGRDDSLTHGRAGLATWQARADFDDVHVASTTEYGYYGRDWGPYGNDYLVNLTTLGGNWQVPYQPPEEEEGPSYYLGLQQSDKSGDARAYTGVPVENMDLQAHVRLDSFGAAPQDAWFGLMARYVDARNYYYVTVRRTGQIQIRKIVEGVVTVLASAAFTAAPGEFHDVQFRVIDDQLELYVDRVPVARAHDTSLARGVFGLATYRTAATWETFFAQQP